MKTVNIKKIIEKPVEIKKMLKNVEVEKMSKETLNL